MDRLRFHAAKPDPVPDEAPRPLLQRLPRRNLRRALFLILALFGILAIKHTGGLRLGAVFDTVAPPPPAPAYRLHVEPPPQR